MSLAAEGDVKCYRSMLGPVRSPLALPTSVLEDEAGKGWALVVLGASPVGDVPDERPSVLRTDDRVDIVFHELALVSVNLATLVVAVRPHPGVDSTDLASLVVDQVFPRIAADAHLVLHAAAVASADGESATLVVGRSGTGKSTLATGWCRDGQLLLGDDTVRIDGATAFPSSAGPRLWPSALAALNIGAQAGVPAGRSTRKRRLGPDDGVVLADRPAVVRRLVLVGPPTATKLAAVRLLSEQALNLGLFDPVDLLDRVTTLVAAVHEIEALDPWPTPEY